jgi:hypothetical protein
MADELVERGGEDLAVDPRNVLDARPAARPASGGGCCGVNAGSHVRSLAAGAAIKKTDWFF